MRRSPIVLAGTAVGLAGVLAYHTSSSPIAIAGATATRAVSTATSTTTSATSPATARSGAKATVTTPSHPSPATPKTRSTVGQDVSYRYGDLQVKVTRSGSRITHVSLVRLDVDSSRSQSIDEFAVPQLQQETLSAQSASIDSVSGASYTSAAYEQSLQSALDKLA